MRYPFIIILSFVVVFAACSNRAKKNAEFVDLKAVNPSIVVEMRYATSYNFVGTVIDGYKKNKCLLTRKAAKALSKAQSELLLMGFGLKVYDCYRPKKAVEHFVRWAKDLSDTKYKAEFYPTIDKKDLFDLGYIAESSSHSRGSTVDVTLVGLKHVKTTQYPDPGKYGSCIESSKIRFKDDSVDMGTAYDCFHELSHTANTDIPEPIQKVRKILKTVLEKKGFVNLKEEWWHFTLKDEPYPNKSFDFDVK